MARTWRTSSEESIHTVICHHSMKHNYETDDVSLWALNLQRYVWCGYVLICRGSRCRASKSLSLKSPVVEILINSLQMPALFSRHSWEVDGVVSFRAFTNKWCKGSEIPFQAGLISNLYHLSNGVRIRCESLGSREASQPKKCLAHMPGIPQTNWFGILSFWCSLKNGQ